MSEQWVIGRYVDGRWEWFGDKIQPYAFVQHLDGARRFPPVVAESVWGAMGANECLMHIEAAQAIAERWSK